MGLTSKRSKASAVTPMTERELREMADQIIRDIARSIDAIAEINVYDAAANNRPVLLALGQEGLTLSYRVNLFAGILNLLEGNELTATQAGLLRRNKRIAPLVPDTNGGDTND
jgi:hypothetical protein